MARPKQNEIPLEGEGVAAVNDRKLDSLCDSYQEDGEEHATIATRMTGTETKILDRMRELKVQIHKFGEYVCKLRPGKDRIKISKIKIGTDTGPE